MLDPQSTERTTVSTHSRPKAAAIKKAGFKNFKGCFNTQPPEGGCLAKGVIINAVKGFNTQPPEGGC